MDETILYLENMSSLISLGYSYIEIINLLKEMFPNIKFNISNEKLLEGLNLSDVILLYELPQSLKNYLKFFLKINNVDAAINESLKLYKLTQSYKSNILKKLSYPMLLIGFLFIFSIFVYFFLMPKVETLFISFSIKKSLLIIFIFTLFKLLPLLLMITIIFICIFLLFLFYSIKMNKYNYLAYYFKIPYISLILKKYYSLMFCIYYSALEKQYDDPYIIITTLNELLINNNVKNIYYEIKNKLENGLSMIESLKNLDYFDPLFITLYSIYFNNPNKKDSIQQYIDFTQNYFDILIQKLFKILIPCIYAFVGIFVISIYISIIIPMMNIISEI